MDNNLSNDEIPQALLLEIIQAEIPAIYGNGVADNERNAKIALARKKLDLIKKKLTRARTQAVEGIRSGVAHGSMSYTEYLIKYASLYDRTLELLGNSEQKRGLQDDIDFEEDAVKAPYNMLDELLDQIDIALSELGISGSQAIPPEIPSFIFGNELFGWEFGEERDLIRFSKNRLALVHAEVESQIGKIEESLDHNPDAGCSRSVSITVGIVIVLGGLLALFFASNPIAGLSPVLGIVILLVGILAITFGVFSPKLFRPSNYEEKKTRLAQSRATLDKLAPNLQKLNSFEHLNKYLKHINTIQQNLSNIIKG